MIDLKTKQYFGIKRLGEFSSDTTRMFESMIRDAILDNQMLAVIASYGSGKTHLFRRVKASLSGTSEHTVKFVHVGDLQDNKVRMVSLLSALVRELGDGEAMKREMEAVAIMVQRLLGVSYVENKRHVCLVVEDAHRLHANTLSALKLLREKDYLGIAPLLSVVLIGWPRLDTKLEMRRDILTRTQRLHLDERDGWMTYTERVAYLEQVYDSGKRPLIERETLERIAAVHKVPVEMDMAVANGLREARLCGFDQLDSRILRPSLKEQYEILEKRGVSLTDIAEASGGIPKTSVFDTINKGATKHMDAVSEGMDALLRMGSDARRAVG